MKKLPGWSILVPAYNEEKTLEKVVRELLGILPSLADDFEILIIDDGSSDGTGKIADELAGKESRVRVVHHATNRGFGGTQSTGFRQAHMPYITLVPGDAQFPAGDLRKFAPLADEADIVLGYRVDRRDSWGRRFQTAVFRQVLRVLFGFMYRDINWVKLYRREKVAGIEIVSRKAGVDAEVLLKALRRGARVKEVQVGYLPRQAGVAASSRPTVIAATVIELIGLRLRSRA